jgi:hypothetical protein
MGKTISSLNVILGGVTSPFSGAMSGAQNTITKFQSSIKGAGSTLLKFTGIGAAIGAIGGAAGIGLLVKSQLEAIDVSGKLADRLGITTQALEGLNHAANLSGVSQESVAGASEKLLNKLGEAAGGSSAAVAAFDNLGLKWESLANMPLDQQLGTIGDALNSIQNPAQRAAAAQDIFGKSGQQLLPLLKEGSAGLAAMKTEADELGLTFNRLDAAKVEAANDAVSRFKSAFVGVGRQIAVAIAPALKFGADIVTGWGKSVVSVVKTYLPVALNIARSVWNGITSVAIWAWNAVYSVTAPIVSSIVGFVSENWRSMLETATSYWVSIYGLASTVFSAVWTVVSTVASGLAAAWTWAMDILGFKTAETGTGVGNVWANVSNATQWMMDQVTLAINVVTFGLNNLGTVAAWVGVSIAYEVVKIGNQFLYVFTDVIPGVLTWFANNWRDVFTTVWNFYKTVWSNIGANTANFAKALWSFLKGDGFNFKWTGLLEGFENTIKEMPNIAERQIGPLEASLADQSKTLGDALGNGLADYLGKQNQTAKDAAAAIAGGISNAFKIGNSPALNIETPAITPPIIPAPDTSEVNSALDDTKAKADNVAQSFAMVVAGSAEALQLSAQAAFGSSIMDFGGGSSLAQPSSIAQSAARESGKNASPDGLATVIREEVLKIINAIKDNSFTLSEAA